MNSKMIKELRATLVTEAKALIEKGERSGFTKAEADRLQTLTAQVEQLKNEAPEPANLVRVNGSSKITRGKAWREAFETKKTIDVPYNPVNFMRAILDSGSGSAGDALIQSTSGKIFEQSTEDLAWLNDISIIPVDNYTRIPYFDRDDAVAAQNKTEAAALTEQAYVINSYSVDMKNYNVYFPIHNNVFRDQAVDIEGFVRMLGRKDIRRAIAKDILYGAGGNGLTGLDSLSTQSWAFNGAITSYNIIEHGVKLLMDKNVNPNNITILMHQEHWKEFVELVDTTNQPLRTHTWLDELGVKKRIFNYSSLFATGTGTIWMGDFSKVQLFVDQFYSVTSEHRNIEKDQTVMLEVYRCYMNTYEADHLLKITGVQAGATT